MTRRLMAMAILAAALALCLATGAQEKRELHIINDNSRNYQLNKVYELKHVKAASLVPYLKNAILQNGDQATIRPLNYKAGNKQIIVMTLCPYMVPYMDEMIAKLDRPVPDDAKINGDIVGGNGIYDFMYKPKHRSSQVMVRVVKSLIGSGDDGNYVIDGTTNSLLWKDTLNKGNAAFNYFKNLDIPPPQLEVAINAYEITESDLRELGIDWIAWKNGPGATLFSFGADMMNFQNNTNTLPGLTDFAGTAANAWGGFLFAPQIDSTYIRLLAQKGRSRIWTSGFMTVMNNLTPRISGDNTFGDAAGSLYNYNIKFSTNEQFIQKDKNQSTAITSNPVSFSLNLINPVLSHPFAPVFTPCVLSCDYVLVADTTISVEQNETARPITNSQAFNSNVYIASGTEKLIGSFVKKFYVKQKNGIPWLSELPVLEYIFGAVSESAVNSRLYLTMEVKPYMYNSDLHPEDQNSLERFDSLEQED